ncbi:hypothetical protein EZS27_013661 [termite gut metagenome]|uniref:Transmembrane protein EpsG n=1 Tax=termite gut metagenome TaxID=433724 RepID=A0A5J4RWY5_9ZZZZ
MIYFIVFLISIFLTYLAEVSLRSYKDKKRIFYLLSFSAILIPSLLAGFRDSGIGTDTIVYVDNYFGRFRYIHGIGDFLIAYKLHQFNDMEFIYLLLNFIVSLFTDSPNGIYFTANFIVILLFYMAAYDNRKKASMWLVMAFFFFLFYNQSYNLVRQSIAIAMTIYAFKYIETGKWLKMIVWLFIIANTHNTGIFIIMLYVIYYVCTLKNKYIRFFIETVLLAFVVSIFTYFDQIILFSVLIGLLPEKFLAYLSTMNDSGRVYKIWVAVYILFIMILWMSKFVVKKDKNINYYLYNKIIGTMLLFTSTISQWAFRISFYLNVIDCIAIPRILSSMSSKRTLYIAFHFLLIFLLIIGWYWLIIIRNHNETYPYTSKILGIG